MAKIQMTARHVLTVTTVMLVCSSCSADAPKNSASPLPNMPNRLAPKILDGQDGSNMKQPSTLEVLTSDEALKLLNIVGVEGLGEGRCDESGPADDTNNCIVIYVSNGDAEFTSGLPTQLSGIPVRIEISDELSIFDAQ